MKKFIKSAALLMAVMWCTGCILPVYASGNSSVILENAGVDVKNYTVQVDCNMSNLKQVTNGKIRITYDSDKLHLTANHTGDIISDADALCEVNDCLTGSKKEGEIVFAFASSGELPEKGCLASMDFSISSQVADGEDIAFGISVEKLAGNEGDVPVESKNLKVTFSKNNQENNQGNNTGGNQENTNKMPHITGNHQSESSGSNNNAIGSSTGRNKANINKDDGSSSKSVKSKREKSKEDEGKDTNLSKRGDKDETASGDNPKLQDVPDGESPLADIESDTPYQWIFPVIVLLILIAAAVTVYKKKHQ